MTASFAVAPALPAPEPVVAPLPGMDPWVAAAIAEAPVASPSAAVAPVAPAPVAPVPPPLAPAPVAYEPPPVAPAQAPVAPAPAPAVAAQPPAAATALATVETPTWPCSACDTRCGFDLSACPHCGTPFMGGVTPDVSLKVPGVGDLVHMSPGAKFGVMAGGAAGVALLLVVVFLILGHIF